MTTLQEQASQARVAIVTGAGQGIGRAIALRLARDGIDIVIADYQEEPALQVAAEIQKMERRALALAVDVTEAVARQHMIDTTLAEMGRLDVLVNNAGLQRLALPEQVTEVHWDALMDTNAKAIYFCSTAALKYMVAQQSGCIINIASAAGKVASTIYHPVYNISKAAVLAMTKTLAHAYASKGIRINAICPGLIDTPMQDMVDQEAAKLLGKEIDLIREERLSRVPLRRKGTPEEVAAVVSFLAGADAQYMTGQALNVTGGMVMY